MCCCLPVLRCRLRVVLPSSALCELLYALQHHTRDLSCQQLLQLVQLLPNWRLVPAVAQRARDALLATWLVASQAALQRQLPARPPGDTWSSSSGRSIRRSNGRSRSGSWDGADLTALASGLARARLRPPPAWLAAFSDAVVQQLPAMGAGELTRLLLGLASLDSPPAPAAAAALLARSGQLLPRMSRAQLVRLAHATAKLRLAPGRPWLDAFCSRAARAPGCFNVSGFGMVVWALAKMGARPEPAWLEDLLQATFAGADAGAGAGGERPGQQQQQQQQLAPQHLANLICAFAKLGYTPSGAWMAWLRAQVVGTAASSGLGELDHFHIEWAWRELHEQYRLAAAAADEAGEAGQATAAAAGDEEQQLGTRQQQQERGSSGGVFE